MPASPVYIRVLRSGSSGNATLYSCDRTHVLIDAGVGPRVLARELAALDLKLADLAAVVFTHCHSDHLRPAALLALVAAGATCYANAQTWRMATRRAPELDALASAWRPFEPALPFEIGPFRFTATRVPHGEPGLDNPAGDPVCFAIETGAGRLAYATDLGHVPEGVLKALAGARHFVLESNHEPDLTLMSARPYHVKRWILSEHGHLSNAQAAAALVELLKGQSGVGVILAHLSEAANHPALARGAAAEALAGLAECRIGVAGRHEATPAWVLQGGVAAPVAPPLPIFEGLVAGV